METRVFPRVDGERGEIWKEFLKNVKCGNLFWLSLLIKQLSFLIGEGEYILGLGRVEWIKNKIKGLRKVVGSIKKWLLFFFFVFFNRSRIFKSGVDPTLSLMETIAKSCV